MLNIGVNPLKGGSLCLDFRLLERSCNCLVLNWDFFFSNQWGSAIEVTIKILMVLQCLSQLVKRIPFLTFLGRWYIFYQQRMSRRSEGGFPEGKSRYVLDLSPPIMVLLGPPLTTWTEANGHPGAPYIHILGYFWPQFIILK